jgi:hypothetical protein
MEAASSKRQWGVGRRGGHSEAARHWALQVVTSRHGARVARVEGTKWVDEWVDEWTSGRVGAEC